MNKIIFVIIYLSGVFISAIAQIILKKSAAHSYENKIKEYVNPYVIISYSIFFGATFCTIYAYTGIPLSFGPILASSEYIFVAILSKFILKENIVGKKLIGLVVIVIGIMVYSM